MPATFGTTVACAPAGLSTTTLGGGAVPGAGARGRRPLTTGCPGIPVPASG